MAGLRKAFILLTGLVFLVTAGCGTQTTAYDLLTEKVYQSDGARPNSVRKWRPSAASQANYDETAPYRYDNDKFTDTEHQNVKPGTGQFIGNRRLFEPGETLRGEQGLTLNLRNVPIPEAAKVILGDILKVNYVVSEDVQGNVTLQTTTPVGKEALLDIFETVLSDRGAAIIQSGRVYKVVQSSYAAQSLSKVSRNKLTNGLQTLVVPLQYVGATEVKRIIEQASSKTKVLRADRARNLLVLRGTASELKNVGELIGVFDVDWMRGMSVGLFPVTTASPSTIVKELRTVFGAQSNEPLDGVIKFLPNQRLSSIMVITSRPNYIEKARNWIDKLDKAASQGEPQLFVYKIQNRRAEELATLLQKVLGSEATQSTFAGRVAPRFEPAAVTTTETNDANASAQGTPPGLPNPVANAAGGPSGIVASVHRGPPASRNDQDFSDTNNSLDTTNSSRSIDTLANARVVADEGKNALLIMALPRDHDRLRQILQRLDVVQTQVMLEAVIAEVSLTDELKFGLRWYFQNQTKASSFSFSDAASGAISSVFPGFSYFFSAADIQIALNAVSSVTDVQVISAPSLMVQDNKTATLQVGDQVPIVTQTAQSVDSANAPVVNSVELKDTGIILKVTPRVNDSGHVVLDIEQEVSDVVQTTTSGIDSPTIQQRKIETSVAVDDGQVVALGGLIQERNTVTKTQVPVLGDIPYVGAAFRDKTDNIRRTELLIFIRPQVIRDASEAQSVTDEFRSQIELQTPTSRRGRNKYDRDIRRALQ